MDTLSAVFLRLLNMSITAGWIVLAVALLRLLLRRAPKALTCGLWLLVAVRLVLPFSFESPLSLIPSAQTVPPNITQSTTPSIHIGIPSLDVPVNQVLHQHFVPAEDASPHPLETLTGIAALLWVAGMAAMLLYGVISFWRMYRRVQVALPLQKSIRVCDAIDSPFILGVFRPVIYLPTNLGEEQRPHIIAHEQAHLKRRDHWWKPVGFLLLTVYWFQPLLWVAYILLCRDIELACDEQVVRRLPEEEKYLYASTLLQCSVHRRTIAACPVAFGETAVKGRIRSVLHYRKPTLWILLAGVVATTVAAVCLLTNPDQPYSDAQLLDMAQQIADNDEIAFSSRAEDYIAASPVLYDRILSGGEDTVDCYVAALRRRKEHGLVEYLMATACARITGVGQDEAAWASANQWLALYDQTMDGILRICPASGDGTWTALSRPDSKAISDRMQKHPWHTDPSECETTCRISIGGQVVDYSAHCGTFRAGDSLLALTEAERQAVNAVLAPHADPEPDPPTTTTTATTTTTTTATTAVTTTTTTTTKPATTTTSTTTMGTTTTTAPPPAPIYAQVLGVQRQTELWVGEVNLWERLFGKSLGKGYTVLFNGDKIQFQELYAPPGTHFIGSGAGPIASDDRRYFYDGSCSFVQEGDIWTGTISGSWDTWSPFDTTVPMPLGASLCLTGDNYSYTEGVCSVRAHVFEKHNNRMILFEYLLRIYGQEELELSVNNSLTSPDALYERVPLDSNEAWVLAAADALDRMAAEGYSTFWVDAEDDVCIYALA